MPPYASHRAAKIWLLLVSLTLLILAPGGRAQVKKTILVINEFGQSAPVSVIVAEQIRSALQSDRRFQVQFYWENLDAIDLSNDLLKEQRASVARRYLGEKLDLIVLVGPDPLRLLTDQSMAFYPDVPVVFCCAAQGQPAQPVTDSRSTGSWLQFEPAKTLDAALRLLPETRQVFVVTGQSRYDKGVAALAKAGLTSYETKLDFKYLTDLSIKELQERLRLLPPHSIVFFLTFFKDAEGREFLSTTDVLPMVVAASNVPVFGVSESYIGRGIVGGFVVSIEEQGKIAGRDTLEILSGKPPQDIPVVQGPSRYIFDWRALRRWNLDESRLPSGSVVLFRESSLWGRYKLTMLTGLVAVVTMALLIAYLLYRQRQLNVARNAPEHLSGLLINAQEQERRRIASEIHDDFSQRLATLTLGMDTAAQTISVSPEEANLQLQGLSNAAIDLGTDLHTLSHRLHSATLETWVLRRA